MMNLVGALLWWSVLPAQAISGEEPQPKPPTVAAVVDGVPIQVRDVERELAIVVQDQEVDPSVRRTLLAKTLQQLVDRQLIMNWLRQTGRGPSEQDIDLAVSRLERHVQQRGGTLDEYRKRRGLDGHGLRRMLDWQIGWRRYLERHLVAENLRRYFESHRRDFDGTRIRVAHILRPVAPPQGEAQRQAAIDESARLRQRIVNGEMTFAEAAQRFSIAPTAAEGGEIGWIARNEPMPEPFSKAAFSLEQGAISGPVVTSFGIYTIKCLEIQPGQLGWQEARDDLKRAVTQYLFTWAADQARPGAKVEFTGAAPDFRPGTEEVADPG